jgi:hypothetical protein
MGCGHDTRVLASLAMTDMINDGSSNTNARYIPAAAVDSTLAHNSVSEPNSLIFDPDPAS